MSAVDDTKPQLSKHMLGRFLKVSCVAILPAAELLFACALLSVLRSPPLLPELPEQTFN